MKVKVLFCTILLVLLSVFASADEGMWLPGFIPNSLLGDMHEMGLKLSAEDIYSINHASVKDAVVRLNSGSCTGSVISPNGLMITCFHCSRTYIQKHNTPENNYLEEGFVAAEKKDELRNEKLSVSFLKRIEDVTAKVAEMVEQDVSDIKKIEKVRKVLNRIQKEEEDRTQYQVLVKGSFYDNVFYMYVYETFPDVRLVLSVPRSIGYYGGETDNWTWPRYKSDFTIFRIYTGSDGKPAPYNKKNVPMRSEKYLPLSIKGLKKDDFTMVMGYPSRTSRYLPSFAIDTKIDVENPIKVEAKTLKLEIMKEMMEADENVKLKYTAKYDNASNLWKYYIGQLETLERLNVFQDKKEFEQTFTDWVSKDEKRNEKYGEVMAKLTERYEVLRGYHKHYYNYNECVNNGADIMQFAYSFNDLYELMNNKESKEMIDSVCTILRHRTIDYFNAYYAETDEKIFAALFKLYLKNIPEEDYPDIIKVLKKKNKGDVDEFAKAMFKESLFSSKDKVLSFLSEPDQKVLGKDMAFETILSTRNKRNSLRKIMLSKLDSYYDYYRLYYEGIMEMQSDKLHYPDANRTMRFSYGRVSSYGPSKFYSSFTNVDQLLVKNRENPGNKDYEVIDEFREKYYKRDFGRYGESGLLKACFITDNDIVNGNSGSPIMNADGELIGIVFDVNWESTSSRYMFDDKYQRTICTDIRFVLYMIDKFAGASHIIDELTILE